MPKPVTWQATIRLDRPPVCPWCGRQLHPDGWSVWNGVAGCLDCVAHLNYAAEYVPGLINSLPDKAEVNATRNVRWFCPRNNAGLTLSAYLAKLAAQKRCLAAEPPAGVDDQYFGTHNPDDNLS